MSVSEKITSIENHISEAYTSLANMGADLTNVDKNIENISSKIDEIYNNAPKTSYVEGSNISISNSLKGKVSYEDNKVVKGNTSQNTLNGYQLWGGFIEDYTGTSAQVSYTYYKDGTIYANGTANANSNVGVSTLVSNGIYKTLSAGTYTVSKTSTNVMIQCYDSASNSLGTIAKSDTSVSFTLAEETQVIIRVRVSSGDSVNETIKVMLCSGNSAKTYEAYTGGIPSPNPNYPQNINVVTGENSVVVCGKNLWKFTKKDFTAEGTNWYDIEGNGPMNTVSAFNSSTNKITLEAGTYYLSFSNAVNNQYIAIVCLKDNAVYSIRVGEGSFTLTEKTEVLVRIKANASNTLTSAGNVQIEVGSTATTYEPYTSTTHTLHLGSLELCKIGDYQDYIYYNNGKWYKYVAIGKITLNGSTTQLITLNDSSTNTLRVFYNYDIISPSVTNVDNFMCNRFQIKNNWNTDEEGIYNGGSSNNTKVYFRINKNRLSTVDLTGTRAWLSSNNVILYYCFVTPNSTEITDTTLIQELEELYNMYSYSGTTNISISGNLPFIMKVRALKGN